MGDLDSGEIAALKDCFDTFDFFNCLKGTIDGTMVGDIMRCAKLNPTQASINANGGCEEKGVKQMTFEEVIPCRQQIAKECPDGTFDEYMEVFRSFDRDQEGKVQHMEVEFILTGLGEKCTPKEFQEIIVDCELKADEDGFVEYEPFIRKLIAGPPKAKKPE